MSAAQGHDVADVITYANGPFTLTVIPEPATLAFLGVAACLGALRAAHEPTNATPEPVHGKTEKVGKIY